MSPDEIRVIEKLLLNRSASGAVRVLEYGAGGSTFHFPLFLQDRNIACEWVTIESDALWAERVAQLLTVVELKSVVLHHRAILGPDSWKLNSSAYRRSLRTKGFTFPYEDYTCAPRALDQPFDLVLVDGRDRKNCVRVGLDIVRVNGIVVLHDAQRPYYRCLLGQYPQGRFLAGRLWVVTKRSSKP